MDAIGTSKAVNVHGVNPILSLKVQFKVFLVMQCNHKKNERQHTVLQQRGNLLGEWKSSR